MLMQPGQRRYLQQQGLTLIELMIALTLGLIIIGALLAVFLANNQSANQTEATAQLQDNGRSALDILGRDISMAGYWGGMFGTHSITPCDLGTACPVNSNGNAVGVIQQPQPVKTTDVNGIDWALQLTNRIEFADQLDVNSANSLSIASKFPGLTLANLQPGSDVVAIRRAAGQSAVDLAPGASSVTLTPYNFYLMSNGSSGQIIRAPASGIYPGAGDPPLLANSSFYKYVARVYYVRTFDHTDSNGVQDNVPSLCRAEICPSGWNNRNGTIDGATCGDGPASASGYYAQCVAEGVESLQIEWGLDLTTPAPDCIVDTYTSQPYAQPAITGLPTAWQVSDLGLSARIMVLVRSTQIDGTYTDNKTYTLADYTMTQAMIQQANAAHYHRRIYSTTVQMRNPNGDSGLCTH